MIRMLVSLGTVLSLLAAAPAVRAAADGPPNVVMIIGDDHGWTDYGFMGHATVRTPNLDRLASQAMVFTRGYVPSSLCRPSLASMITGRYAHQHGITGNDPPLPSGKKALRPRSPEVMARREEMVRIFERNATLPGRLGALGYASLQTGKWWEGNYRRGGFASGMTHGDPSRGGRHGDDGLRIGRETMQPVFDFLDTSAGKPFFLWYAPMLPHQPHNPPERLLQKYRDKTDSIHQARYWAMCEWFDETCGQLLDYLDRKGLAENTLVVFLNDNGWTQDPQAPRPVRSKLTPYDAGLRTPVVLRWPRRIAAGRDERTPVMSVDLAPTIAVACGLKPDGKLPGVDLRDRGALESRERIFGEIFTHNEVDLHRPAASLEYRWTIEGPWKLILPNPALKPQARPELYDLLSDPRETRDLASQEPDRVRRMTEAIDRWWAPGP